MLLKIKYYWRLFMKKTLTTLLCTILFVLVVLSVSSCSYSSTAKQLDDLQAKLTQQQAQLQQVEDSLKHLQEKNEELESQYSALIDNIQKLQTSINKLANHTPYEDPIVAKSQESVWNKSAKSYVIYTQTQLQQMLDEFDVELKSGFNRDGWYLRTDDGTEITEDFFNEQSLNFNNKALIVSIFYSPCLGAKVTRHNLWKNEDTLHVEIDYTCGDLTAVETVMVIMKVDKGLVTDVNSTLVEINK